MDYGVFALGFALLFALLYTVVADIGLAQPSTPPNDLAAEANLTPSPKDSLEHERFSCDVREVQSTRQHHGSDSFRGHHGKGGTDMARRPRANNLLQK